MSEQARPKDSGPGYEAAAGFRLRPERPHVMRLSRKVLAGLAGAASLTILGLLIAALDGNKQAQESGRELFNTENKTAPEGLASLPKDYASLPRSIPQLGPPLPGDLGRPILNAQQRARLHRASSHRNSASRRRARRPARAGCFP